MDVIFSLDSEEIITLPPSSPLPPHSGDLIKIKI